MQDSAPEGRPKISFKINHLHLKTPDPRKTAQWHMENLGATIVSEAGGVSGSGSASYRLNLHGVPLNVTGFVDGQKLEQHYGLEHIAIDTDDLPGTVSKLKEGGRPHSGGAQPAGRTEGLFL